MSILVTSGCGFIGSNFINSYFFENSDAVLVNIDGMHYCDNENNVHENVRASMRYHFIEGNISSYDLILNILKIFNITNVVNFVAQSHIQKSFDNALQFTHDNVIGTQTLLEACRKYGKIKKFVHVSIDEACENDNENEEKKHENSVFSPTNPYNATKIATELIAKSYYHSFKMPIAIARGRNVYVNDVCSAVKLILEKGKIGEIYNICGGGTSI
jgi:dTDP-D-glucose 4,6-dehydratase